MEKKKTIGFKRKVPSQLKRSLTNKKNRLLLLQKTLGKENKR